MLFRYGCSNKIDAALVRVMKTRKAMKHVELMAEIFSHVKFPTTNQDIKARIESLIEREYLDRDKANPNLYIYLA